MALRNNLRNWLRRRLGVPDVQYSFERLAAVGFAPQMVFDVGAYEGEFIGVVSNVWPETSIACFEVQPGPLSRLQQVCAAEPNRLKTFATLLGPEANSSAELYLAETASSVFGQQACPDQKKTTFPMTSVSAICREHFGGKAPDLLKLDVQGFELEVIKGAESVLPQVSVVLAELNLLAIYDGVPLMHEVTEWLASRGFVMYDVGQLIRRPKDNALWQLDALFVQSQSLWRGKSWA